MSEHSVDKAGDARRRKRGAGPAAIGSLAAAVARPAFERHGFATAAIVTDWPAIAGPDFAAFTAPERLIWPRRFSDPSAEAPPTQMKHRRAGATLVLRVDGPRALEIQHAAPQIVERVNVYFGYAAVAGLRIIQAPVRKPASPAPAPAPRGPLPDPRLDAIDDEPLRAALARLAARIEAPDRSA